MENGPFIDDFPIKTSIYKGFSMAMLNNQMVNQTIIETTKPLRTALHAVMFGAVDAGLGELLRNSPQRSHVGINDWDSDTHIIVNKNKIGYPLVN